MAGDLALLPNTHVWCKRRAQGACFGLWLPGAHANHVCQSCWRLLGRIKRSVGIPHSLPLTTWHPCRAHQGRLRRHYRQEGCQWHIYASNIDIQDAARPSYLLARPGMPVPKPTAPGCVTCKPVCTLPQLLVLWARAALCGAGRLALQPYTAHHTMLQTVPSPLSGFVCGVICSTMGGKVDCGSQANHCFCSGGVPRLPSASCVPCAGGAQQRVGPCLAAMQM